MLLTKKEQEQFIKFYKARYGDTSKELPSISKEQGHMEIELRNNELKSILGKKYNKLYKHRQWGDEGIGQKVFNDLWLNYGPKLI